MESGVSLLYHTFSAPALDIGFGFSSLLVLVFFFSTPDGSRLASLAAFAWNMFVSEAVYII